MSQTPVRSDAPVTTVTPMVVTGSPGDRPFPEAAPEVERSGRAPLSSRGQRLALSMELSDRARSLIGRALIEAEAEAKGAQSPTGGEAAEKGGVDGEKAG